jgi:2-keto-4-pentenoate hydratase
VAHPDVAADARDAAKARVAHTANVLFDARRAGRMVDSLAPQHAPTSLAEAFAVQGEMTRLLGLPIVGWKVGLGPGERITHAPVYEGACVADGAHVRLAYAAELAIEGEIAFVLRHDLPMRAEAYTADEVADAVAMVCAAIEIGAPRLQNFMEAPLEHKIADNMGNGALIRGSGTHDWRGLDLARLPVRVEVDAHVVTAQIGGNSAGNPFDALVALANAVHRSEPLIAGQTVITGTCTGIYPGRPGNPVRVVFDGLGKARVTLD